MNQKKVTKLGQWIPYDLTVAQRDQKINLCTYLDTRSNIRFKNCHWVQINNLQRKRQQLSRKLPASVSKQGEKHLHCSVGRRCSYMTALNLIQQNRPRKNSELPHSPYSPDLASTDYCLYNGSTQKYLFSHQSQKFFG